MPGFLELAVPKSHGLRRIKNRGSSEKDLPLFERQRNYADLLDNYYVTIEVQGTSAR